MRNYTHTFTDFQVSINQNGVLVQWQTKTVHQQNFHHCQMDRQRLQPAAKWAATQRHHNCYEQHYQLFWEWSGSQYGGSRAVVAVEYANVAHFAAGEPLEGPVDPAAGY